MEKIKDETSDFYRLLIAESHKSYGDHGATTQELNHAKADLNDPELIRQGKEFVQHNFYSVMLAHLVSLMWVFTFKPGRQVLLHTGYSGDVEKSLPRYLSTLLHIKLWYENFSLEQTTDGSKDLQRVRKMHENAARQYHISKRSRMSPLTKSQIDIYEAVKKATTKIESSQWPEAILTEDPEVPFSQFSMVITQFCFIGFIVLSPDVYGIENKKGIAGFVHLWAIFGRFLGIEDRFNLAIHYKNTPGSQEAFKEIYTNIFLPNLKNTDETAIVMWSALIEGCSMYIKPLNLKAAVKFMLVDGAGLDVKDSLDPVMTWKDKLHYGVLIFATRWSALWDFTRKWRNFSIMQGIKEGQRRFLPKWNEGTPSGQ